VGTICPLGKPTSENFDFWDPKSRSENNFRKCSDLGVRVHSKHLKLMAALVPLDKSAKWGNTQAIHKKVYLYDLNAGCGLRESLKLIGIWTRPAYCGLLINSPVQAFDFEKSRSVHIS
jgi:hypothetical protein